MLIPAVKAARNLGITRRALRNRINAGLVRSVHVGLRVYVPKTEIERIVNGEAAQAEPQPHNENSSSEHNPENVGKSGQNGEWHLSESCWDANSNFDGKKWLEKFRGILTEADCEHKELTQEK